METRPLAEIAVDALYRHGFVPCDIPACNCGSWHHRYGLPERMREIAQLLEDAGHALDNSNGNLPRNALAQLIGERDALSAEAGRLREALSDMLDGWKYIRSVYGDLYGVGWDRAQNKAEAALTQAQGLTSQRDVEPPK